MGATCNNKTALLLCDVDGTLVDGRGDFFRDAKKLISDVGSSIDIEFGLCSARPMFSLKHLSMYLERISYISSCQGASVYHKNNSTWTRVTDKTFSTSELENVYDIARTHKVELWLFSDDNWFAENRTYASSIESAILRVEPLAMRGNSSDMIRKAVIVLPENEFRDAPSRSILFNNLKSVGVVFFLSKDSHLEITSNKLNLDKGAGEISRLSKVTTENTFAIGDGDNDYWMLSMFPNSATFEDSSSTLKQVCAYVVENPSKGGLVRVASAIFGSLRGG